MQAIYTLKETYQILKVSRRTVLRWIETGQLKAFKLAGGRLWRIRERDLQRFIEGNPSMNQSK
jgi:excisionase family DNA binding protein